MAHYISSLKDDEENGLYGCSVLDKGAQSIYGKSTTLSLLKSECETFCKAIEFSSALASAPVTIKEVIRAQNVALLSLYLAYSLTSNNNVASQWQ
jgi:hypothetical protein